MFFHKNKKYEMDIDTANAALQNILAACNQAPNTIPFDKILLRQKADTKPYNRLIVFTALLLLLTFLAPLAIVPIATKLESHFTSESAVLINDYLKDNVLYLQFTGDNILYEQAYMESADGERIHILSYDADKGLICFPYAGDKEFNIYIPMEGKPALHFLLTPKP